MKRRVKYKPYDLPNPNLVFAWGIAAILYGVVAGVGLGVVFWLVAR